MIKRRKKNILLLALISIMLVGAPSAMADIDINLDLDSDDADLDSCAGASSGLGSSLGCDTDDVIDFTEYTGDFEGPDTAGYDEALTQSTNARDFIQTIVNYALSFLGLFAIIMVIYGGVLYVLSRGDEDMAGKGRKTITYAGIGIIIVLGSFAIVNTLIGAGGGGGASDSLGGGTGSTTISDAGANFDVDDVLTELEDVAADYVDAYETLVDVKKEIAYMDSLELPYILTLTTETKGVQGFGDKVDSVLSGEGVDTSDTGEIYDESGLNDFINGISDSAQDIQLATNSLSDSYYIATEIYVYLTTNTVLDKDFIEDNFLSTVSTWLMPVVLASDYSDAFTQQYSGKTCGTLNVGSAIGESERNPDLEEERDSTGIGSYDSYTGDVEYLGEDICILIDALDVAAENDFEDAVNELANRIGSSSSAARGYTDGLLALFDTDLDGASSLETITTALTAARTEIAGSSTTINVNTVQDVISALDTAYTAIEGVQFVSVVLDVSETSGNAPLIVAFDAVGTEDPSGETVDPEQIEWDLDGDGNFDTGVTGYSVSYPYDEEGSYRVRVRVKSKDSDIAAGIATVTINVDARRSKIVLKGYANDEETVIADFRPLNKFEHIDKDTYRVTSAEAEAGIVFDASDSVDGNDQELAYIEWDFGDTEITEGAWSGGAASPPAHYYTDGSYEVSVTVTDGVGSEDRKYFTLYVGSPAARISYSPSTGVVGDTFKFDGSGSSTDVGTIVSYSWSITGDEGSVSLDETGASTLDHEFEAPGVYTVQLQVSDSSNNKDTASVNVVVESTPPVASFECELLDESSPGTLSCDASDSYDPDEDEITYLWDFDGVENDDFEYLDGGEDDAVVIVRFLQADEYEISMTVTDDHDEDLQKSDTYTEEYVITSVLEVEMDLVGDTAKNLDATGEIDVDIIGETTGEALEVDCGNSTSDFTDALSSGRYTFTCTYDQAGIYSATMTAYDEDGDSTSDTLRIYIGSGDDPIAVIDVDGGGEDIGFDGTTVYGNVDTKFTFDASNSVNIDGSTDTLTYSWNFGNGKTSSSRTVTTSYDEIAVYTVTLTVRDSSDNSISSESTLFVDISPIPPKVKGLSAIPQADSLETPLKVTVSVDASDDDGDIEYIKAWYYDLNDTAEALGTVIAQSSEFSMTINTNGEEGDEVTYGFAVEVTDSDNMTVSSENELSNDEIPTLTVVNGPNDSPVAAFSVDRTSVFVGEEITFINESYDPDGEIIQSWWDIGADGSHNDDPVEGASSLSYEFTQVHADGIEVRLKVEDSAGATDFSDSITIFVDTLADPPDAKFLSNIEGTTVSFTSNSDFDEENGAELQGVYWDFNLEVDSDGNGVADDDFDSFEENPVYTYDELGIYQVMMTVVDTTGQTDVVTQDVNVIDTEDPTAAFSYTVDEKQVKYKNESIVDTDNGVDVRSYAWDFDLEFDADDDGDPENDVDSTKKSPTVEYDEYGSYEVSLTVEDSFGKVDVIQETVEVSDPVQPVTAVLTAIPQPNSNGQIVLTGSEGEVTFFFSAEDGSGTFTYQFDKNIFYDTNLDGIRDNDIDYADEESGTWTTDFFESYGTIVVALTVTDDETGESDTTTMQVVFQGSVGGANLLNATPQTMSLLILSALLAAIGGVALVAFTPSIKS